MKVISIKDKKYGIVDIDSRGERVIIPFEYDNILQRWEGDIEYILYKSGKVGAIYMEKDDSYWWIAPCEYDSCDYDDSYGNLMFSKEGIKRYYFCYSKTALEFSEIDFDLNSEYMLAVDESKYYIMSRHTGATIWCESKRNRMLFSGNNGAPCFIYMGAVDNRPLFYDCNYDGYLIPYGKCGIEYRHNLPNIIKPIIVNGVNIVNIVSDVNGMGGVNAVEYIGRERHHGIKCDYDEVSIELKVKLKKGERIEERIYPIPYGRFSVEDVCDYSEWF